MKPNRPFRLGTRASPLAMAQAHLVKAALLAAHGWDDDWIEINPVTTLGDQVLDRPLAEIGGKALWTKPLDHALVNGEIDFAVHSMKDVETARPAEIVIAAVLARADPRDRLIGASSIAALPERARVGTSSPRRAAQLRHARPDLCPIGFRGNVATRLAKLAAGDADATLLAAAGLDRLGQSDVGVAIDINEMIPAVAQGIIAIEARHDDQSLRLLLAAIDHAPTHDAARAERALLLALNGDCHSPIGSHARLVDGAFVLTGEILSIDGDEAVRASIEVSPEAPRRLADMLLERASANLAQLFGS